MKNLILILSASFVIISCSQEPERDCWGQWDWEHRHEWLPDTRERDRLCGGN